MIEWKETRSSAHWRSTCGRFHVKRSAGAVGVFVYVYRAYDNGYLIKATGYASEARHACQMRLNEA